MRFSILVPVYNVEDYLPECLDSIINQSFKNFELICINDGSTDKSLEILQAYSNKDPRIKIVTKKNQGLLWARRDAIKIAQGEYILFIDSDDKYHDLDALNRIDNCLLRHKNPELLLFDRAEIINDKVVYTCPHFYETERCFQRADIDELRYNYIVRNYLNAIFLKCIKTDVIKRDKTDYSVHNPQMAEDVTQSMFIFDECKTVVFLPDYIYLYRNNSQSITRAPLSIDKLESKMVRKLFSDMYSYIEKWNLKSYKPDVYQNFFNKVYSFYCGRVLDLYLNKNNKHLITKIKEFEWFNDQNLFLKNTDFVKISKLSKSFRYLSFGLIKQSSFYLRFGLIHYNLELFANKTYQSIRKVFRSSKNEK